MADQQSLRSEYEARNQEMQKLAVLELERLRVERTKNLDHKILRNEEPLQNQA